MSKVRKSQDTHEKSQDTHVYFPCLCTSKFMGVLTLFY
jgi:hypothetical protein